MTITTICRLPSKSVTQHSNHVQYSMPTCKYFSVVFRSKKRQKLSKIYVDISPSFRMEIQVSPYNELTYNNKKKEIPCHFMLLGFIDLKFRDIVGRYMFVPVVFQCIFLQNERFVLFGNFPSHSISIISQLTVPHDFPEPYCSEFINLTILEFYQF